MRRVFFSFEYEQDVWRANQVRNSWVTKSENAGYIDAAAFEKLKKSGDIAVQNWILEQLKNTSVTVILLGAQTCKSKWVNFEYQESMKRENGILGIDISGLKNQGGFTTTLCGNLGNGYPTYNWITQDGYKNLDTWVEAAAKRAGR